MLGHLSSLGATADAASYALRRMLRSGAQKALRNAACAASYGISTLA